MGVTPFDREAEFPTSPGLLTERTLWLADPATVTRRFVVERLLSTKLAREVTEPSRYPADAMHPNRAALVRALRSLIAQPTFTADRCRSILTLVVRLFCGPIAARITPSQFDGWVWFAALAGDQEHQIDWLGMLATALEADDPSLHWLERQPHADEIANIAAEWTLAALPALDRSLQPPVDALLAAMNAALRLLHLTANPATAFCHRLAQQKNLTRVPERLALTADRLGRTDAIPLWGRQVIRHAERFAAARTGGRTVVVAPGGSATKDTLAYSALMLPLPLRRISDPLSLRKRLLDESPWLARAITELLEPIELLGATGKEPTGRPPCLLVGAPGSGKTHLAQRFAALAGLPSRVLSVAGSSDNRALHGTAKGWSSATPAFPLTVIKAEHTANPVIILDEIDKAAPRGHNGSVIDTLHMLLEPGTAKRWLDECLETECDLSHITYIATANSLSTLPRSLLSRFQLVFCPGPAPQHFDHIVQRVCREALQSAGLDARWLLALASRLHRPSRLAEFSVRDVQRQVQRQLLRLAGDERVH